MSALALEAEKVLLLTQNVEVNHFAEARIDSIEGLANVARRVGQLDVLDYHAPVFEYLNVRIRRDDSELELLVLVLILVLRRQLEWRHLLAQLKVIGRQHFRWELAAAARWRHLSAAWGRRAEWHQLAPSNLWAEAPRRLKARKTMVANRMDEM